MRCAVYAASKNYYPKMVPALKSLLMNSNVEKVYFLIEDDEFPEWLPSCVEIVNISNQKWFPPTGCNYDSKWTYVCMLRCAYAKLFPDLDRIVSFDVDTFVLEDISDLWDLDLTGYYIAGVREPLKCLGGKYYFSDVYINVGVTVWNLDLVRHDKKDDALIDRLNRVKYSFPDQDVVNRILQGKILTLPGEYNSCDWTEPHTSIKIKHFAAVPNWENDIVFRYFSNVPWDLVYANK